MRFQRAVSRLVVDTVATPISPASFLAAIFCAGVTMGCWMAAWIRFEQDRSFAGSACVICSALTLSVAALLFAVSLKPRENVVPRRVGIFRYVVTTFVVGLGYYLAIPLAGALGAVLVALIVNEPLFSS
jgi:hypothetical protein